MGREQLRTRERAVGAVFVTIAGLATLILMGPMAALLIVGLIAAYLLWSYSDWNKNPAQTRTLFIVGIVAQSMHLVEEYATGFHKEFPGLLGYEWSDRLFLAFNLGWLALFVLAAIGLSAGVSLAYLVVFFFSIAAGIGSGVGHLALAIARGGYYPGAATAPAVLIIGTLLLARLLRKENAGTRNPANEPL
jgi:MFS family permease